MEKLALSVTEAAELLGLSAKSVYTLSHSEDFPAFSVGGRTIISAEGLKEWVDKKAKGEGTNVIT